ncbi:MAG: VCBS repeat-containing protein, partial [Bacteroidales bacterium]|nr:VCBS repeat-containing protein [Bacteroidales bacterium]
IVLKGVGKNASCITSQLPFSFDLISNNFNAVDVGSNSVPAIIDLDNDGLLDLIIGTLNGNLYHYRQVEPLSTSFVLISDHFSDIAVSGFAKPCFADLDGNGLLELIIGETGGALALYRQYNTNPFLFSPETVNFNSIDVGGNSAPALTDLDGDGLWDLIIGEWDGNLNHYEQISQYSLSFSLVTEDFNSIYVGNNSTPGITDLEGDGLMDLFVGESGGNLNHYRQQSWQSISFYLVSENFNYDIGINSSPCFTDLDDDGLIDLIEGNYNGNLYHFEQKAIDTLMLENIISGRSYVKPYYLKTGFLHDNLKIMCNDSHFGISLSENTGFTQSLSIAPAYGYVSDTVYVRFDPDALVDYNGLLMHTANFMDTAYISLKGTGVESNNYPGAALDFSNVTKFVRCSDEVQITGNNPRSVEAWANARAFYGGAIFSAGLQWYDLREFALRTTTTDEVWRMQFWGNDLDVYLPGSKDSWHHYCLTFDGSVARLYYDGKLMASHTVGLNTGRNYIQFGHPAEGAGFHGRIDEVCMWDYALDSTEIRERMHLNLTGFEPGLVGYWQFNEGSGNKAYNILGGSTGRLLNMDDSNWVISTIPFGGGVSASETETTGLVNFTGTGLWMDFNSQTGASITATRIDTVPNINPAEPYFTFNSQFWVVNRYGTGSYNADITFTLAEDLISGDQNNPADISLYRRGNTADTNWAFLASASAVNAATDQATFNGITVSGQFIIARETEPAGIQLDLTVLLEGPFNGSEMNTMLNSGGQLPLSQPYNTGPWNYTGTEAVAAIPNADVVDWILIELRDAPDAASAGSAAVVARQAGFLRKDGTITSADGFSLPLFTYFPVNSLFAVVWHRNSIGVMSAIPLTETGGVYAYDFTTGASQAYGGTLGHKEIAPGAWGMIAADGNADNQVNNGDKNDVWAPQAGTGGYTSGDFNLDAQVNNGDKNDVWVPNTGLGGQVPQ